MTREQTLAAVLRMSREGTREDRLAASDRLLCPDVPLALPKPSPRIPKAPQRIPRKAPIQRSSKRPARKKAPRKARKTTLAALKRKLWERCRGYVRETHGNACFTCGATDLAGSNWHSGHFVNAGKSLAVRYAPDNLRPQCLRCNMRAPYGLGGNTAEYAIHLLDEIGEEKFRRLLRRSRVIRALRAPEARALIEALQRSGADYELAWEQLIGLELDRAGEGQ